MRVYTRYYDDSGDAERISWERSQTAQELRDDHLRAERHNRRYRNSGKDCHRREAWNWDGDDSEVNYSEDLNGSFRSY